jgi:hypothetical protein
LVSSLAAEDFVDPVLGAFDLTPLGLDGQVREVEDFGEGLGAPLT